jgi:uncharacterized membrane-anchored protein
MAELWQRNHPQRDLLEKELQQRFFPALQAPCRICHFMLTLAPSSRQAEFQLMQQRAAALGVQLHEGDTDLNLQFDHWMLRWERHSEFSTYSFIYPGTSSEFHPPESYLPTTDWFDQIPGQLFRVVQLLIVKGQHQVESAEMAHLFTADHCISSLVAGQQARIWTDFRKHPEGGGRMLLSDEGLSASALARLVQQLFDLGNYRKLSLLGFPQSRQAVQQLHQLEQQLSDITHRIEQKQGSDEHLLHEISQMAAQTEHLIANNSARLEASAAYYQLTMDRLKALREMPVPGLMSLQDFSERRLTPAYRTAQSVLQRQASLSNRLGRSTELLRTRINLQLERQNSALLASMDQRARQQLQLQTAVERLSTVAICYYAVQLLDKTWQALSIYWPQLPVQSLQALNLPLVMILLIGWWYSLRHPSNHQAH